MEENMIHEIKEALAEYQDAYASDYDEMRDDLEFKSGKQWEIEDESRLNLVMDHINKHRNRIVNPIRIHPFGFGVQSGYGLDPEQAIKLNSFFARLQHECGAYSVYADAMDSAVTCGRGFVIIGDDWRTGDGIEKKLVVSSPLDPTCVFIDPSSESLDGSDAEHAGLITWIGKERAKRIYGVENEKKWDILPNSMSVNSECVPMVSYWTRASEKKKVIWIQTEQGIIGYEEKDLMQLGPIPADSIVGIRDVRSTYVDFWQVIGNELQDKARIESPFIPVVPFYGIKSYEREGNGLKVKRKGIVHLLRDTQKLVNLAVRSEAERLDMAPKSPYIAEVRQIANNPQIQQMWDNANAENRSALLYEQVEGLPPPQRNDVNPHTSEIQATRKGLQMDMTEQMGMSQADFGGRGMNDPSGFALSLMQETADYQTAEWIQNAEQSVIQCGRIVAAMAPSVYRDGVEVQFDTPQGEKRTARVMPEELKGNLKICITTSASYQNKKKQGAQILSTLAGQNPEFALAFVDEILKNSGAEVSEEALARAKKMVPAHLSGEAPDPMAMQTMQQQQAALDQMASTLEKYEAYISQLQSKILGDSQKAEIQLQGKIIDSQTQIVIEKMKQDGKMDEQQAQMVANVVKQIYEDSRKAVDLETDNVEVKYTSPMSQFTPMVAGPLVTGAKE